MIVAEFSVTPVGLGSTSEREVVEAAIREVRKAGVQHRVGPFGTAIEAPGVAEAFEVVRKAHEAAMRAGAGRVLLQVRVDDRRDKAESIAEQVAVGT